jgi:RNA polymerase sigma-70 factor (ECF subfamily)
MGIDPEQSIMHPELELLFTEQGPRMWRALLAYAGDPELASDAVAEAFTRAMETRNGIASPSGWLWRVAFRVASNELKSRRRVGVEVEKPAAAADVAAIDLVLALRKLSPRQRGAIVLHYYSDYPVRDVARILGSSPPAVRVHLMRGRRRLRQLLEASDG